MPRFSSCSSAQIKRVVMSIAKHRIAIIAMPRIMNDFASSILFVFRVIFSLIHKTLCRINRTRACNPVCLLSVFRNLYCDTHSNSSRKAFLSAYWLPLGCLSQAKSIQLRVCILLLSLAYLFPYLFLKLNNISNITLWMKASPV